MNMRHNIVTSNLLFTPYYISIPLLINLRYYYEPPLQQL